jgi:hypothetical protein
MSQGGASIGGMTRGGSAEHGNAGAASQMDRASNQGATGEKGAVSEKGAASDKSSQSAQSSGSPSGAESKSPSGQRSQSSQADRDRGMGASDRDKNQSTQAQQGGSRAGQNAAQQNTPSNQGSQGTQTGQAGRAGTAGQSGTTTGQAGTTGTAGAAGQTGTSTATTGGVGGAAGSNVTLNTEQKTRIRQTVLNGSNVPRVNNVNFALNVGTVVPQNVRFAPLPPTLVEINPGWRSYEYFVVQEEIIIIDPHSRRIIAVLPV